MLKWKDFSIGGYNFNDWNLVRELYVPEDISASTDKSLHERGREGLEHHLQHYVVPADKRFIAFAVTNVEMTTTATVGIFGTGKSFGRYPVSHNPPEHEFGGAPITWSPTSYIHYGVGEVERDYYYNGSTWGSLVLHKHPDDSSPYGRVYECCQTHAPDPAKEPQVSGDTAWWLKGSEWNVEWVVGRDYFFNELELVTVEGHSSNGDIVLITGAYMCMVDHTSHADNKPCSGVDWDIIWNPGDEFTPELSSQYGFSVQCLNVSKGTNKPFSRDILAIFDGSTSTQGRRIDAMTIGGTMKAGATLYGIEVDA